MTLRETGRDMATRIDFRDLFFFVAGEQRCTEAATFKTSCPMFESWSARGNEWLFCGDYDAPSVVSAVVDGEADRKIEGQRKQSMSLEQEHAEWHLVVEKLLNS